MFKLEVHTPIRFGRPARRMTVG